VAEDEKGQTDCFIYFLGASEIVGILWSLKGVKSSYTSYSS
jgi:hypothetical protein